MKKLVVLFAALAVVIGWVAAQQPVALPSPRASSGNTLACCPASADYVVKENWEGAGNPGWTTNAIVANHGAVFFDVNISPLLEAGQYLQLTNGGHVYNSSWHPAMSEVWYYFIWRPENIVDGGTMLNVIDSSQNPLMQVVLVGGTLRFRVGLGAQTADTTLAVSEANTFHVWVHYKAGTGADAIMEVHLSSTPTKPNDGEAGHAKVTTGTSTANATGLWFFSEYDLTDWKIDKCRADDVVIGSDPT